MDISSIQILKKAKAFLLGSVRDSLKTKSWKQMEIQKFEFKICFHNFCHWQSKKARRKNVFAKSFFSFQHQINVNIRCQFEMKFMFCAVEPFVLLYFRGNAYKKSGILSISSAKFLFFVSWRKITKIVK